MGIAVDIIGKLVAAGVKVEAAGDKLKLRPTPPAELLELVRAHKGEIVAELTSGRCPHCRKKLDGRQCWRCHVAWCECGRVTESAFILVCRPCEVAAANRAGVHI